MSLQSKAGLHKKLANKKFRDAFVASRIAQTIALQARILRQREGLSQIDLAKELGTSQNAISRLENPAYGKPSITTLRKVASHHNVGLIVRFAPLSEIVDWTIDLETREVVVPDFEHDAGFIEHKPQGHAIDPFRREQPSIACAQEHSPYEGAQQQASNVITIEPRQRPSIAEQTRPQLAGCGS